MDLKTINIRKLKFWADPDGWGYGADAVWNPPSNEDGAYEVCPLVDEDGEAIAWEAIVHTKSFWGKKQDQIGDKYPAAQDAMEACQKHSRERCITLIEGMLA